MKYFTRDYWLSLQRGYVPPPPERDPFRLYHAELEVLRGRLDPVAFGSLSDPPHVCVHDAHGRRESFVGRSSDGTRGRLDHIEALHAMDSVGHA